MRLTWYLQISEPGPAGEGPPGSGAQTPQPPPGGMEAPPIPTVPFRVYTPQQTAPVQGVPIGAAVEPAAQGPAPTGGAAPPAEHQGDGAGATSPARSISSVSSGWTARSDRSTGSQLFMLYQETARAWDDVTMVTPERQGRLVFPTIAMSDSGSESDPASSPTPGMKPGPSHVLHWPLSPSPPAPQA
ncbi:hypothetical protein A0H81_05599 [Grifola frondosa]|uniref:Uncharacterized protein n=1 Tax=Grifola frondosa TaxID=5627 RepID=A0A1C7MBJ8_GRIFR|nr:hypothetical protein A0H81_05599 [Grifola frondosa]